MMQVSSEKAVFELKANLLTLTVFYLTQSDLKALSAQLQKSIQKMPQFFKNLPIIIDLGRLPPEEIGDLGELKTLLRSYGLVPVGVRNLPFHQQQAALVGGLAVLSNMSTPASERQSAPTEKSQSTTKIIQGPVRSGQQHCALEGDLVILGSVGSGAELLAHGSIHVYGTLRGRALAGIHGNRKARIFCRHFGADLVSIAGQYKFFEQAPASLSDSGLQVWINSEDHLQLTAL